MAMPVHLRLVPTEPDIPRRPRTRADCREGLRPCPYASCRHHLLAEVSPVGTLFARRGEDPAALPESCSLDVADRGQHSEREVAAILGVSHARVLQLTARALKKASKSRQLRELDRP
jgi:hypothetical protein